MDGPPADPNPPARPPDDRLDSWKEIAGYLKRDVSTVQRWERREGMPVHRHLHDKIGSVYAIRGELDAWAQSRKRQLALESDPQPPATEAAIAARPFWLRPGFFLSAAVAAIAVTVAVFVFILTQADYLWQDPIANARFVQLTDFEGAEHSAAISRDGKFVAFLSDRDGRMDAWVTQVGTGQFYNLTHGSLPELVNPSVRTLGFSPDSALVLVWARSVDAADAGKITIWAIPTLGGTPRPYLEDVAELDWSHDGSKLVYHTPGPGDPTFVTDAAHSAPGQPIFAAPSGLHAHFPLWSPDDRFIYFVQGTVPNQMDIWRVLLAGGAPERVTYHNSQVSHPVLLTKRELFYLATDDDGSGPWIYGMDLERRISHRLRPGLERYTSLAASADGKHLVVTLANPKTTLWRFPIRDTPAAASDVARVTLTTGSGSSPRLGSNYLLYVAAKSSGEGIWKLSNGSTTELWSAPGARMVGAPAISSDGRAIAFAAEQDGRRRVYVMNADGSQARLVTESLEVRGAPAWSPDGQTLTVAVESGGVPRLVTISLDGRSQRLVSEYSIEPAWSRDGKLLIYSGPDVGTTFQLKAVTAEGQPYQLPELTLTRGARHVGFLPGRRQIVVLKGEIEHKNLWLIDLETGSERQLTNFGTDFVVRNFDVSPDGREIVVERVQENSDIGLYEIGN